MKNEKQRGGASKLTQPPDTLQSDTVSEKLKESARQLEKQRNDLQTIYYIADQLSRSIQPKMLCRRVVELTGSVFGSICVLIAGHFHPESQAFHGTVTYPEPGGEIVERPFPDEGAKKVPFYNASIVGRWIRGELDDVIRFRVEPTVAYPLQSHGRRLGLILAPAADRQAPKESSRTRMNPEIVQAARQHLAVALELSELQREQLQQERLAAIGQTVASLAHYLKNVLNGLKGGEYVIERALKNDNPEKIPKGLAALRSSIRHIERLTYDMLYYAGDRNLDLQPANPNEIMQEVLESLEEIAAGKRIDIKLKLEDRMIPIPLDRHALYRAILNLATNAIDACLESDRGNTVTLKSSLKAGHVLLSVEDNGVGISPGALKRVTERFYTTKPSSGTGLGLTVTKKIAEQHGGVLEIESVLGHGSTFHIRLPRS
ncbi:MAG: HAMP domain-containing histidine kinase [Acidobacteria bacterium]|nr:HAMP domain-containing histidine kinase [Acidobacteriota bacterium]